MYNKEKRRKQKISNLVRFPKHGNKSSIKHFDRFNETYEAVLGDDGKSQEKLNPFHCIVGASMKQRMFFFLFFHSSFNYRRSVNSLWDTTQWSSVDQGEEFHSVDTLVTGTSVNRKYLTWKLGRVARTLLSCFIGENKGESRE